ncbi:MAG: carbon-nitrogen hydrolase family protein [Micromonosporaceae bacterium]|jgi:predicted amidohydrolase
MSTLIAAAQFASPPGRVERNTLRAVEAVREAAHLRAALVVLPEYAISGFDAEWIRAGAPGGGNHLPGPAVEAIAAAQATTTVVVNDLERDGDRLFSTSFIIARGEIVGRHRKTILTEGETAAGLVPGDSAALPVQVAGLPVPVAPMICFEHGFPEIALDLALAGAGIIAISSAIRTGTEYLRNLRTRARAQDNGCYVVAANATGGDYCGESMIVDPRGEVLARAGRAPEVITAPLDPELIAAQRRAEPVLRLRRPELRRDRLPPEPPAPSVAMP